MPVSGLYFSVSVLVLSCIFTRYRPLQSPNIEAEPLPPALIPAPSFTNRFFSIVCHVRLRCWLPPLLAILLLLLKQVRNVHIILSRESLHLTLLSRICIYVYIYISILKVHIFNFLEYKKRFSVSILWVWIDVGKNQNKLKINFTFLWSIKLCKFRA